MGTKSLYGSGISRGKLGVALCGALVLVGLCGCGGNFGNLPSVDVTDSGSASVKTTPIGTLSGQVYGGQQPIYQGHVYLMKASKTGYGTASISILGSEPNTTADTSVLGTVTNPAYYVTTDFAGNFNITGDYSCTYNVTTPADSDQLFLVGLSGNTTFIPGTTPTGGSTNPYIGEMAVLGQCPSNGTFAGHLSYIYMNEVSTVAAAYALAGFATNSHSVGSGSSAQAQLGLANAFANANQLYDIQGSNRYGEARTLTPNGNGTVPNLLINTVADILASCINQTGTSPQPVPPTSGTNCSTLYSKTGSSPDAASAAIYIAQHPGSSVSALYGLVGSGPQFADDLSSQPKDFAVGIEYNKGTPSLANPVDVAIDAGGNAWVTSANGYLSQLSPLGVQATGSPYTMANANYVAIDTNGYAWATAGSQVYELTNTGATVAGTPYNGNGLATGLAGIAADANGAYVANPNSGLSVLGLTGSGDVVRISGSSTNPTYGTYYNGVLSLLGTTVALPGIPNVSIVANGSNGYVWISGDNADCLLSLAVCVGLSVQEANDLTMFPSSALLSTPVAQTNNWVSGGNPYSCLLGLLACGSTEQPEGLATDHSGQVWVAVDAETAPSGILGTKTGTDELVKLTAAGAVSTWLTGGGISTPFGVAVDGAGNVFVANSKSSASSISEFTNAGTAVSTSNGYGNAVLSAPTNLDIDPSGDVWVVNPGSSGFVTEFIGIATPVARPLSVASGAGTLGYTP